MEEKKLTGYPSIDKPQNKYYRTTPVREIKIDQTIYNLIFDSNRNNMDAPALEYMGVVWTFEKLKSETDRVADAFIKAGVKLGDVVLIGIANCLEGIVSLLALNYIGAVSKWFDIRATEKDIEEYANTSNCKYLIAFDMLLPRITSILNNTKIEKVLIINPTDSLSRFIQAAYKLKAKKKGDYFSIPSDGRYIRFADFVKKGNASELSECVPFNSKRPSIMIQSSGTTGKPKIIVHSDLSATAYTHKIAHSDLPIGLGKVALVVLPPWIAFALGDAIITPLAVGTKVILVPSIDPDAMVKYLGKFTVALTAPVCYRYLKDNYNSLSKKQLAGLKRAECLISGGDKITVEENAEFERLFDLNFINGYGNNEGWGCLTVNPTQDNHYGTVGIPKFGETIISYDNDMEQELKYDEIGEICVQTDTMFLYYENNPQETNAVKKLHADGKIWLHTGDLGSIDEAGFVTLHGRMRRVIIRKAFKISAYTIEDKICEHPTVKECVAVEVNDAEEEHVPMAFIVLKDEYADNETSARDSIIQLCHEQLKDYEVPKHFQIVASLPYTPNGKYDFRQLEQRGNAYVTQKEKED